MSSMRNAVQRRNHKERAQPLGREKWGLLEKHKDYALRAKDHKDKQKRLKILKEKAALANPDEFSFGMMSSRTRDGVKIGEREGGRKGMSMEVVRLLKTQDVGYVRTMLQKTRKERERLEREVQLDKEGRFVPLKGGQEDDDDDEWVDEADEAKRISFVESRDEQEQIVAEGEDSDEGDEATTAAAAAASLKQKKLSRKAAEAQRQAEIAKGRALKKRAHQQEVRRELLRAIRKRENDLAVAEQELDLQRAKMSNSVGGVNKDGLTFKIRQRKK